MTDGPDVDRLPVKLALFVMGIGAAGMLLVKPVIVGGLIDSFGYTPREAGLVAGIEMAGVGLGTLTVVLAGDRWNGRAIAATGAAIGLVGSIGPSLWSGFALVMACRLLAGLGCGVLVSVVISALAVTRDPDRSFSLYYMASAAAGALFFPTATALVGAFGVRGAYLFVAALLLPVYALLGSVPVRRAARRHGSVERFPIGPAAVSLSASVIYWIGTGAVWAFIERIGVAAGLAEATIGAILAASQITFVLGAFSASLLHTRIGRAIPAAAGVLLSILALGLIRVATNGPGFGAGVLLFTFGWMFFFPYLTGTMAAQDASGRIAVLGVPSQTLGLALGPAIAGFLIRGSDYGTVILFGGAAYLVAILVLLPALLGAPRAAAGSTA
jgi:predicted MFS family arabinose efflux permease